MKMQTKDVSNLVLPPMRLGGTNGNPMRLPESYRHGIGLGGLGELLRHPAVGRWQRYYNIVWEDSQAYGPTLALGGGKIEEDEKYGSDTNAAMKRWANLAVRIGLCTGTSSSEVNINGPAAARACLTMILFTPAMIAELQLAWREWRDGVPPATPPAPGDPTPPPPPPGEGGGSGREGEDRSNIPPVAAPAAGWLGPVLLAIDLGLGSLLAGTSKKW